MENREQPQTISATLAPPSYAEAMGFATAPKYEQPVIPSGQQSQGQPLQVPPYPVQSSLPGYPYQNNYYLSDELQRHRGTHMPGDPIVALSHETQQRDRTHAPSEPIVQHIILTAEDLDPRRKRNQSCCSKRIIIFVTFTFLTLYLARLIFSVVRVA